MSRKHMHLRRYDDTWSVKGVLTVHPPKPTLSQAQAIVEGLSDLLDLQDMAAIAADGITGLPPFPMRMTCTWANTWDDEYGYYDCCHECACGCDAYYQGYAAVALVEAIFPTTWEGKYDTAPKVEGALATFESDGYDARKVAKAKVRANARRIAAAVDEAQAAKRQVATGQPAQYGSLIQVSTRQRTRR